MPNFYLKPEEIEAITTAILGFTNRQFGENKFIHNLVEDNLSGNDKIIEELGFNPKTTFYCSLPKIVEGLNCRSTEIST